MSYNDAKRIKKRWMKDWLKSGAKDPIVIAQDKRLCDEYNPGRHKFCGDYFIMCGDRVIAY